MTQLTGNWITAPPTRAIMQMLEQDGHKAYFVGGCVRNALLGVPVSDIDIATDARPARVMDIATNAGLNVIPTGIDHGTVTVVSASIPHEITTFRRDVETDGRRAVVSFSDEVADDARRRDFTMNALYADIEGVLIDPLGGLSDLKTRRVRFIEDANNRIEEDYLRILRFFRFHAWFGDAAQGLDADGLAACAANSAGIETLSKERIGAEMRKLLAAPDPAPSVGAMAQTGILMRVLAGADTRNLPLLVHLEQEAKVAPDAIRRLAVLGGEDVTSALRLSKHETRRRDTLHDMISDPASPAELGYRLGMRDALDVALLRAAVLEQPVANDLADEIAKGADAAFPVSADDLMPEYSGPALGARLKHLESQWIASGFTLTRAQLLA